ncbi:hypothetical protein V8C42DRAFT_304252 [Trichoderma barbatum]
MPGNANHSDEMYHFITCVRRVLTLICWLCQQLQQFLANVINWLDKELERGSRREPDVIDVEMANAEPN